MRNKPLSVIRRLLPIPMLLLPLLAAASVRHAPAPERHAESASEGYATAGADAAKADTVIRVDEVQVTAIKQGAALRSQPVAATIAGSRFIERNRIGALKDLSQAVPNFHAPDYGSRMTSSIYVRGLGARIDQPVVGLNIDNVPVLNKDNYDTELADAERIEVLRGPQSTLYGRNTMGGVINVYTLSPLDYQGVRLTASYGSGETCRLRASVYQRFSSGLGMSVTGYHTRSEGFFENLATGAACDRERMSGGRWKLQWRGSGFRLDNTFSFSVLEQGGYPYAYAGEELRDEQGRPIIRPGEIRYNDPSTYDRKTFSDGLTMRWDAERFSASAIVSYQYSDDEMNLDQDFLPLSYFTLTQARTEHTVTADAVFRSRGGGRYGWLAGAFGFYRRGEMSAPVCFKETGIERLILANANAHDPQYTYDSWDGGQLLLGSDFLNPSAGGALYHESDLRAGRWRFTAGLRIDCERTQLRYRSRTQTGYTATDRISGATAHYPLDIDIRNTLQRTFVELLPKISAVYAFDEVRNLYVSIAKGYKAGGFNTQMFSNVLQQEMMSRMGFGEVYDPDEVVAYDPEYSWNYELGGHFSCMEGAVRGDFALFYIDCRDQQLTVFPPGSTTGRMMTNAGRTRSMGAEAALQITLRRNLEINAAYGYTDARFLHYETTEADAAGNPVRVSYKGKRIPYAPKQTLSAGIAWTLPTGVAWLGDLVLQTGIRGTGSICWDEANRLEQPFYTLLDASVRLEHPRYGIDLWGRNLTDRAYDLFYFKSVGNEFLQRGRPRTFGITLHIYL